MMRLVLKSVQRNKLNTERNVQGGKDDEENEETDSDFAGGCYGTGVSRLRRWRQ